MRFYQVDPTQDARWAELAERHPGASVFHSVAWLKALRRTYGYEPVAFTTSSPTGELKNGLVFCHVNSWLRKQKGRGLPLLLSKAIAFVYEVADACDQEAYILKFP